MVFCHKLVFPATNTGYSLQDLLTAAGFTPAFPRVAGVKIGYTAELGTDAYIVPNKGSYANTGGVPDDYGYSFSAEGPFWEFHFPANLISLDEIILGSPTASDYILLWAYSV